mgnify:CR=1 FL=1|tara:strand:+ start:586 stop:819 length:234 start_codon:yes stop_codon:yes gene_type:complete
MADLKNVISQKTLLPVGLVAAIMGGVLWINSTLMDIDYKLQTIELKLENSFTKTEMENWSLRLQMANSELEIPSIEN